MRPTWCDIDLDAIRHQLEINALGPLKLTGALRPNLRRGARVALITSRMGSIADNESGGAYGYRISKAALNMLTKLYAKEQPQTHFCAFAPGLVETPIQDTLQSMSSDARFPSLDILRSKRGTVDMPEPREAARRFLAAFDNLLKLVASGEFADIRSLPG